MSSRRLAALSGFALATLPAQPAFACAMCFSGRDETRVAYLLATLFMTSLPLVALALGILWVVKKANAVDPGAH